MAVCGIGIGWRIGLEYPFRIVAVHEKAVMVVALGYIAHIGALMRRDR